MYTMKGNEIFRNDEVVATINDGELDFLEGMAKFRAPAVRFYNSLKDELLNEAVNDLDTDAPDDATEADTETKAPVDTKEPKAVEKGKEKAWIDVLSEIVGVEMVKPHPRHGYRLTGLRPLLMKKYNAIVNSPDLDNDTKKMILNAFV